MSQNEPLRTRANIRVLSEVAPEKIQWLWRGFLALGKLHLFSGDAGLGKTTVALDIAARVSKGNSWPLQAEKQQSPGGVVIAMLEDELADTIRPRLDVAGADMTRIVSLESVQDPEQEKERAFSLRELDALEDAIDRCEGCKLVIIDPITAVLAGADMYKDTDVRSLLAPLGKLASRKNVAILLLGHLNKNSGASALYRFSGSVGIPAAARIVISFGRSRDDQELCYVVPAKVNIGPKMGGLAYRIVFHSEDCDHGRVEWDTAPLGMTADDMLSLTLDAEETRSQREDLDELLKEVLHEGRQPFMELSRVAKEALGVGEKAVRGSLKRIDAQKDRDGVGKGSQIFWHLDS